MKSGTEICEILGAYDLTHSVWSAAELVGCHPRTVRRYVQLRDSGQNLVGRDRPQRLIDPFLEKVEEKVEASKGKIRADIVHDTLVAMGFIGTERTANCQRAVSGVRHQMSVVLPGMSVIVCHEGVSSVRAYSSTGMRPMARARSCAVGRL